MPESGWADRGSKRKNVVWFGVVIVAGCVGALIFLRNNSEILWGAHSRKKESAPIESMEKFVKPVSALAATPSSAAGTAENRAPAPQKEKADERVPKTAGKAVVSAPKPAAEEAARDFVTLGAVTCRLVDKSKPSVMVSLSLGFADNKQLRQEILVKRDNLKVMVQKTLAAKSSADIKVDSLRKDIKSALNSLLENGTIADVEIKEFKIDKAE